MQGRRVDRIEEQLRIEISDILEREVTDPRIGLTTVTNVKVSPDLSHARIFVTVLGTEEDRKKTIHGLKSAAAYIRRSLSKRLHHLRRIPELAFEYDESIEQDFRIEKLFEQIKPDIK
jgi:ribosome-binding factor A